MEERLLRERRVGSYENEETKGHQQVQAPWLVCYSHHSVLSYQHRVLKWS